MTTVDPTTDVERPAYHLTPRRHWMNDPNGLVRHDGEWHAFFQHNPEGVDWGNMSWGHAVSADLVHWEELPVAIRYTDDEHVFSGSVVVDEDDTAGFGAGAMVAVYTSHAPGTPRQSQSLAWSTDRGRTWERYAGNPVLDLGLADFRDPKVFRYADRWVMAVALAAERVVRLYGSADLRRWEHLSDIGPVGAVEDVWECPDLFPLAVDGDPARVRWVLVVSVQGGGPAGGSATQWVLCDFDGTTFTPDPSAEPEWLDWGADNYAAVSFSEPVEPGRDDERVLMGWMSNWSYAHDVPAGGGYRGAMTLPRRVSLRTLDGRVRLVQRPVAPPGRTAYSLQDEQVAGVRRLPVTGSRLRLRLEVEPGSRGRTGVRVRVGEGEHTEVGYDAGAGQVYLDRTAAGESGFAAGFAAVHRAPYRPDGPLTLDVHVDSTSVEVFVGEGEVVLTDLVFPAPGSIGVELVADETAVVRSLEVGEPSTRA